MDIVGRSSREPAFNIGQIVRWVEGAKFPIGSLHKIERITRDGKGIWYVFFEGTSEAFYCGRVEAVK